jgi:hypothetical protein
LNLRLKLFLDTFFFPIQSRKKLETTITRYFLALMHQMFLVIWSVLDTISMDFFKQKFIETTRTDIFDMLLSSGFKSIKKLTLSCFVSLSIPTFLLGCFEMFLVICIVLDTISMDFLSKNSLKPLELTFLSCYYRQVLNL